MSGAGLHGRAFSNRPSEGELPGTVPSTRAGPLVVAPEGREPDFSRGLLTAVVQDAATAEVLMVAHMDRAAYETTLLSRRATFHSRSRDRIWVKGEISGNVMDVVEVRLDCDGDAVLLRVRPRGPACHTGARSCFESVDERGDGG